MENNVFKLCSLLAAIYEKRSVLDVWQGFIYVFMPATLNIFKNVVKASQGIS